MINNTTHKVRTVLIAATAALLATAASSSFAASGRAPGVGTLSEHVTYTYDVPWDAVHRYPPALRTYEYAQGCHTQQQTVPGSRGGKQTVNIIRCY